MNNKPQCHTNERNHMHQTAKLNLITEPIKCDAYGCQGQCMQESIRNKQKQPRKLYYIAKYITQLASTLRIKSGIQK